MSGDLTDLGERKALFTVVTRQPATVTAKDIAQARRLAVQYGGVYGGVIEGNHWLKPRIVAAYRS